MSGWQNVKLGDVVTPIRGVTFGASEASTVEFEGSIACLTTSGVQNVTDWNSRRFIPFDRLAKNEQILQEGDLLVSTANSKALVGKSCIVQNVPLTCTFGAFVTVLRPKVTVEPEFLALYMRTTTALDFFFQKSSNTTNISNLKVSDLVEMKMPMPPRMEQQRMTAILTEQMATIEKARAATLAQLGFTATLINSYLRYSLSEGPPKEFALSDCLTEVSRGIGADWQKYPLVGATRAGIAPAKESIGKTPERYKLVDPNTIFYNPMRILLGSIAMIDENDQSGITSPDYVVFKTTQGILNTRWFYYWLRSPFGEDFIKSLTRGAVRERLLFRRLASAKIKLPCWESQCEVAEKLTHIIPLRKSLNMQLEPINKLTNTMLQRAFNEGI